jgi:pimeloyl-ACP methyl ester carboxylesterase
LIVLAVAAIGLRLALPISTPAFRTAEGKVAPDSVAVIERWPIHGILQTVIIRGRDRHNPLLIWLHGDSISETPVLRQFNAVLEDHFTVVYWDQRYAGRSLDFGAPKPKALTIDDYVGDLDVLVDRLQARFGTRKVVIVGHSWGTAPGVLYAQRRPDKVAAYVGVSQVTNTLENEQRSYAFALREAGRRGDRKALAELRALGPPPRAVGGVFTPRKWLNAFGGGFRADLGLEKLALIGMRSSEANGRNLVSIFRAPPYMRDLIDGEFSRLALDRDHLTFAVPVFLLSGRQDHQSEASLAWRYFQRLSAPRKAFVWFEESAHNPPFEEPGKFNAWMIRYVRPLADADTGELPGPPPGFQGAHPRSDG